MRYSILGFNQEKLIQYDIDMSDVLLLDYIQKAVSQPSMIKTFEDEQPYVWLQHEKILNDLPILNIKESMLKKRLSKLVEIGLIKTVNYANRNGRGSRAYYTITESFEALQYNADEMSKCNKLSVVERPSVKNYTPNNQLISDSKLSNNSITINSNRIEDFLKHDDIVKPKKLSLWDKCVSEINDFTDDEILREYLTEFLKICLDNSRESGKPFYSSYLKSKLKQLKSLSTDNYIQRKIVMQTLDNGWAGFYALKEDKQYKKRDVFGEQGKVKSNGYTDEDEAEDERINKEREKKGMRTRF